MLETRQATLLSRDRNLLWHPYGSLQEGAKFAVTAASGPHVQLRGPLRSHDDFDSSVEVLDGMSSWWAKVHGYRHPAMDAALLHGRALVEVRPASPARARPCPAPFQPRPR